MSKYIKISLYSAITAAVLWFILFVLNPSGFEFILTLAAIAATLIFAGFFVVGVFRRLKPKSSPYRVFAVTNGLVCAAVVSYAIYDIKTDTGWFAGLIGTVLLVYVVPMILLFLLADYLLWRRSRSKGIK